LTIKSISLIDSADKIYEITSLSLLNFLYSPAERISSIFYPAVATSA